MLTADDVEATGPGGAPRHPLVWALVGIVFAEAALLVAATVFLIVELIIDVPASFSSAIALTVVTAIAAAWLGVTGVGLLQGRPWVRGAIVVWQILQLAVAVGSFQGTFARPDIGWLLLAPALAALALVFTRPVIAATVRR